MIDRARPGLVTYYDIQLGNGAGLFLQPQKPHGVTKLLLLNKHWVKLSKCRGARSATTTKLVSWGISWPHLTITTAILSRNMIWITTFQPNSVKNQSCSF